MTHEDKKNLGFNKSFGDKPICPILIPELCHSSSLFLVDMTMVVLPESFMLPIPTIVLVSWCFQNFPSEPSRIGFSFASLEGY